MKKMAVAGLLTAMMAGASAQVYVGGTVGVSQLELDCTGATTCDDTGSGSKIYGGYKFTPNVGAEVGYINFGKAKAADSSLAVTLKSKAMYVAVSGRADMTPNFALSGRLGLANVKATGEVSGYLVGSDSESSTKAYLGVAAEYAFTKNFKGVASADFTQTEFGGDSGAVRLFSVGVQYDF
jgi:hypothetical protein